MYEGECRHGNDENDCPDCMRAMDKKPAASAEPATHCQHGILLGQWCSKCGEWTKRPIRTQVALLEKYADRLEARLDTTMLTVQRRREIATEVLIEFAAVLLEKAQAQAPAQKWTKRDKVALAESLGIAVPTDFRNEANAESPAPAQVQRSTSHGPGAALDGREQHREPTPAEKVLDNAAGKAQAQGDCFYCRNTHTMGLECTCVCHEIPQCHIPNCGCTFHRAAAQAHGASQPLKLAFEEEYRGFSVKAYWGDAVDARIEMFENGQPYQTFVYPAYRIFNIQAHFTDMIDAELRKREAAAPAQAQGGFADEIIEACAGIVEECSKHNPLCKEWDEVRSASAEIRALKGRYTLAAAQAQGASGPISIHRIIAACDEEGYIHRSEILALILSVPTAKELVELAMQNECRRRAHIGVAKAPDFSAMDCKECMIERISDALAAAQPEPPAQPKEERK